MKQKLGFPGNLHSHTDYSNLRLRDSINTVSTLIDCAIDLGHRGIAITEHDTIANAIQIENYYDKIKKTNPDFKVIRGNEIYLCRDGLNQENYDSKKDRYYHWILLAKDAEGHRQIREISSRAWSRSYTYRGMRRVPTYYQDLYDIIGANPGHVIASTACLGGALGTQLLRYKDSGELEQLLEIKQWLQEMQDLFGKENFYLELQPADYTDQRYVNKMIVALSKELNMPTIITTDAHYLRPEDRPIHKAFLTAQQGNRETDDFYKFTYMMKTEEIYELMKKEVGEEVIQQSFANINKIFDSCEDYSLKRPLRIPYLPTKPIEPDEESAAHWAQFIPSIKDFMVSEYPSDRHLIGALTEVLERDEQYRNKETYDEIEINLQALLTSSKVNNVPWSAYLLNVKDYVDLMWEEGDSVVGVARGSGGGFILNNILGISQFNPLREKTETFFWRFLNPERVSELDIDIDTQRSKRPQIYRAFENRYGKEYVARIATFKTEGSKSAILTAARGLGIDVDEAAYLSGLLVAERGATRTLSQSYYGDEEEGIKPNREFKRLMDQEYPQLWKVASHIEGLINGLSSHAAGIIITDEPFYNSTALMKTRSGDTIVQYDMKDVSEVGLIKIDALTVEALDRIRICLDLLIEYGYIKPKETLRETYEDVIGVYNLERDDPKMWDMVANHEVQSLFQLEQQSGLHAIELVKPTSVDEIALLSSVMRLMPARRGDESPLDRYARIKYNPSQWYDEMTREGLTQEEQDWLKEKLAMSPGLCVTQESLMSLLQEPEIGGHSLAFADQARKAIGKKDAVAFGKVEEEYFRVAKEKNLPPVFINYVWTLFLQQRNYSFNAAHTLSYALIALQEMNLAYRFPIVFWNTACLIVDSGGLESAPEVEIIEETAESVSAEGGKGNAMLITWNLSEDTKVFTQVLPLSTGSPRTPNYGKTASAIGRFQQNGIKVLPPNINKSTFTFSPDVENNAIHFGLAGITAIGEDLIRQIIDNRPYSSFEDFLSKVKLKKPNVVNLIKSGAFEEFGDRFEMMKTYIASISDTKKTLNLRNMKLLIDGGYLPNELDYEKRIWNLDRYLKKHKKNDRYLVDDLAYQFFEERLGTDKLIIEDNLFYIRKLDWDKIYKASQDKPRAYIKKNLPKLLEQVNEAAMKDTWEKYASGNIRKWEMDSVSYYSKGHELDGIDFRAYNLKSFNDLSPEPEIDYTFTTKDGKEIKMLKIHRLVGTVLDKDKTKRTITMLTRDGVCQVKIYGAFAHYDKQIKVVDPKTGKGRIAEKSMFARGNKIIVCGYRSGEMFIAKKYKKTPYHTVEQITHIHEDGTFDVHNRGAM